MISLFSRFLLPLLFPQRNVCPVCYRFADEQSCLCAFCQAALEKQRLPRDLAARSLPPLTLCLAVYPYKGTARQLVRQLKYCCAVTLAQPLGEAMCLRLIHDRALYRRIDVVIPVPLHESRRQERGYNQAELLAKAMCAPGRLPLRPGLLVRIRETGSQVGRNRAQRMDAMRHAFAVTDPPSVQGKCILLVDDVFTTGATVLSCADALYAAGAKEVAVITVCRV